MAEDLVSDALESLVRVGHSRDASVLLVPKAPGMYAFHGDATAWAALGLVPSFAGQPLYIGKAERSLHGRDVGTHFAAGKTGSSTVRRSLAALLADDLHLVAVPRNLDRHDRTANFGLDLASEDLLSGWMGVRLSLSTWAKPDDAVLEEIETEVLRRLRPPLNLDKVGEPRVRLRRARSRLADRARRWRPKSSDVQPIVGQLLPSPVPELSGSEPLSGVDASVADFWRFAMSDLRTNNVRGYLAEFLVARAVGSKQRRVEWDPWDVTAPDGTRIEVKSAGYLQAWTQKKLSVPTFRVAPTYSWDAAKEAYSDQPGYNADVYVFCLQTAVTHDEYDPLSAAQWEFFVADRTQVEGRAGASMGTPTLARLAGDPVPYSHLRSAIEAAAARVDVESER